MEFDNNTEVLLVPPQTPSLENLDVPFQNHEITLPRTCDNLSLLEPVAEEAKDIIEMYNDINSELKESVYTPKTWVQAKLKQVKMETSLHVETSVLPETVKIVNNTVFMEVATGTTRANTTLEVQFFQDGVIKCKCLNPVNPSKFSFELVEKPANLVPISIEHSAIQSSDCLNIPVHSSSGITATITYSPFNITVTDSNQEVLFTMNKNKSLMFDDSLCADFGFHTEYLYGLAEHASNFLLEDTRRERPYRFFNQDICGYPVGSKNGVYGAIPIIVSRKQDSPTFVSIYWPNCSDTYIDIHKRKENGNVLSNTYWLSERGNLEFYAFISSDPVSHFRGFASVLGHCAMPQLFGLGYHQSRYSYKDQKDVLEVSRGFADYEIPCDSITLDIDHTDGKRYFTWDTKLYPDPEGMQKELANAGRQLVTICDPHIKVDKKYHVYHHASTKGLVVKTAKNKQFIGKCWPGDSVYLDYLNEETRKYWGSLYSFEKYKFSTPNIWAWNDMNEPSVFELPGLAMPLDNLHTFKSLADPKNTFQVEHREVHNIYGFLMSKGTYEGLIKRNKSENIRPHALSRSCYAGSQKYAAIWTGDTRATWPYLKATVPMLLSLSLCGISYCGGDVGGFIGDPEPELAVRWYQLGTFMPYFRGHSECNCKRREPWLYSNKYFKPIREAIRDRYRILPYYYTLFEEHCRTAVPIMRPLWFEQTSIANRSTMFEQERFMVGSGMLVVPVVEKGKKVFKNFMRGMSGRWYDFYTKNEVKQGDDLELNLQRIGCFVKGGHTIPNYEIRSHTRSTQDAKACNISLFVALDEEENSKGSMYFDDGETFNYKKGAYMRKGIKFSKNTLTWENEEEAGYVPTNRVTKVVITGAMTQFTNAVLMEAGKSNQKIQLIKGAGIVMLEFVAMASQNWKIVLN